MPDLRPERGKKEIKQKAKGGMGGMGGRLVFCEFFLRRKQVEGVTSFGHAFADLSPQLARSHLHARARRSRACGTSDDWRGAAGACSRCQSLPPRRFCIFRLAPQGYAPNIVPENFQGTVVPTQPYG